MKRWHPGEDATPWARRMRKRLGDILTQQQKLESERHEIINALWGLPQPIFDAEFPPETFRPWTDVSTAETDWKRFHPMLTSGVSDPPAVSHGCVAADERTPGASSSDAPPPSADTRLGLPPNTRSSDDAQPRSADTLRAVPPNTGPFDYAPPRSADTLPAVPPNTGSFDHAPPSSVDRLPVLPPNMGLFDHSPPPSAGTRPVLPPNTGSPDHAPPPSADTRPVSPPNTGSIDHAPPPSAGTLPALPPNTGSSDHALPPSADTRPVLPPNTGSSDHAPPPSADTRPVSPPNTGSIDHAPPPSADTRPALPPNTRSSNDAPSPCADTLRALASNMGLSVDAPPPCADTLPAVPPHARSSNDAPPPCADTLPTVPPHARSSNDAPSPRADTLPALPPNTRSSDDAPPATAGPCVADSPRSSSSSSSSILVPIRTQHPNVLPQHSTAAMGPAQKTAVTPALAFHRPFRTSPSSRRLDANLSDLVAPLIVDSSDDEPVVTPRPHAEPSTPVKSPNRMFASSFIGSPAPRVDAASVGSPWATQSPAPSLPEPPAPSGLKETIAPITTVLPHLSLEFFRALDSDSIKQWMRYFGMKSNSGESFMRNRLAENCKYLQTGVMPAKQARIPERRRKNDGAEREILNAIRQTSFFEEILTFSPIDLNELQAHLREADTRVDLKSLRDLLEAKGVTIKMTPK